MHWADLAQNDPESKAVGDLSQDEYEALTGRQFDAVTKLIVEIDEGVCHPATSFNDLTPHKLADEYGLPADDPTEVC